MSIELRLPLLADAMTAARLGAWLKREGDPVTAGEPLVEVETDKTNVEIEAPASGILQAIHIPAGADGVAVGALLATIAEAGDSRFPRADTTDRPTPEPPKAAVVEFAKPSAVESHPRPADPGRDENPSSPGERAAAADGAPTATPVARKIAQIAGLDLSAVQPSRGSRITKADVEQALGRRQAPPSPAASGAPAIPTRTVPAIDAPSSTDAAAAAAAPFEERSLSAMRRVTAARLQQAKQTIPHFYLHADCRVDALLELRARWNASANAAKITITDALVFLASRALKKVPLANSAWTEGGLRVFSSSDIAVAVNTPAGLITPVIRGADTKNIVAISRELAALAERARAGTLKPAEYSGGTFTISNLGMYGVTSIVPIVNPPQACILGVGAIEARPVVAGDAVVPGRIMTCTLAADHRAIDGATGAEFLSTLRRFIEDPWGVLL